MWGFAYGRGEWRPPGSGVLDLESFMLLVPVYSFKFRSVFSHGRSSKGDAEFAGVENAGVENAAP